MKKTALQMFPKKFVSMANKCATLVKNVHFEFGTSENHFIIKREKFRIEIFAGLLPCLPSGAKNISPARVGNFSGIIQLSFQIINQRNLSKESILFLILWCRAKYYRLKSEMLDTSDICADNDVIDFFQKNDQDINVMEFIQIISTNPSLKILKKRYNNFIKKVKK